MHLVLTAALFSTIYLLANAVPRTTPPLGAVIVNAESVAPGQFANLSSAVASLPNDNTSQSIFMFPGVYSEQVLINRKGPVTILGYTSDTMDFTANEVVLVHNASLATSISDDTTGTLRVKSNNVSIYNLDIRNDFGVAKTNGQAIALSAWGGQFGAYACRFFSYQDTLYTNEGTQVYLKSYIEGAVDFIFGSKGQIYLEGNTIASKGSGCITASGREVNDSTIYVFNENTIIAASDAFPNVTGNVFLGRPWGDYANVVFKNTFITAPLNKTIWSIWQATDPRTDHVFLAEFNSTGPGVDGAIRPSFSTLLNSSQAELYTISTTVGADWASWVDTTYLT